MCSLKEQPFGEPAAPIVEENGSKSCPVDQSELSLPEDQESKLKQLLTKHAEVFAKSDDDLGYTETVKHTIRTADEIPITQPYRGLPPGQHEEVKEHIQKLLDTQVIRESQSLYALPIVMVRKNNGTLLLCVDYRVQGY